MEEMEKKEERNVPERNREFQGIGIWMVEASVHVDNDQALKKYMGFHLHQALELARQIRKMYRKKYGKALRITTLSLAVELLGHFTIQEVALKVKKILKYVPCSKLIDRFCDWLLVHMDVIDCGEKQCDNNRFLWDMIAVLANDFMKIRGLFRKER